MTRTALPVATVRAATVPQRQRPGAPGAPSSLRIGGMVPFSTTDYPDRLAAVVFLQGCPWRCRYCHNPHLQPARAEGEHGGPRWASVLTWLETRQGLLDAVVFSGGEPTAQPGLCDAVRTVRAQGFAVGLHTAGVYPRRLAALAHEVDWIGLDIKAPAGAYAAVTGIAGSGSVAFASLEAVQRAGVAFEVRTTVHGDLTPPRALLSLAATLADMGVRQWTLQAFRAIGCADAALGAAASPLSPALLEALRVHVPTITVR